jgi:Methyltransferase domain
VVGHKLVIGPLLAAVEPDVVVEVGVSRGSTTRLALSITEQWNSKVHAIDPAPGDDFDLEALQAAHGERLVFHRALSLEVLPELRDADAVLIDGDHNWYTVYNELTTIARVAAEEGRPFPLTLMHDVDWPYADRDMYYAPDLVPDEYRQPYEQAGILLDRDELVEEGGINAFANNAVVSGGPRNGVRTAIDDFLSEAEAPLAFTSVIGFFGLGVLYDERQVERHPLLGARIAKLDSPEWLKEQCRRIERGRLKLLTRLENQEDATRHVAS